jgi:hypothetical protein
MYDDSATNPFTNPAAAIKPAPATPEPRPRVSPTDKWKLLATISAIVTGLALLGGVVVFVVIHSQLATANRRIEELESQLEAALAANEQDDEEPISEEDAEAAARDEQRRFDLDFALTSLSNYRINNNNQIPTDQAGWDNFLAQHMNASEQPWQDPLEFPYTIKQVALADYTEPEEFEEGQSIIAVPRAVCNNIGAPVTAASRGDNIVALVYKLEGDGVLCVNN